jgi:hypothetical protein
MHVFKAIYNICTRDISASHLDRVIGYPDSLSWFSSDPPRKYRYGTSKTDSFQILLNSAVITNPVTGHYWGQSSHSQGRKAVNNKQYSYTKGDSMRFKPPCRPLPCNKVCNTVYSRQVNVAHKLAATPSHSCRWVLGCHLGRTTSYAHYVSSFTAFLPANSTSKHRHSTSNHCHSTSKHCHSTSKHRHSTSKLRHDRFLPHPIIRCYVVWASDSVVKQHNKNVSLISKRETRKNCH